MIKTTFYHERKKREKETRAVQSGLQYESQLSRKAKDHHNFRIDNNAIARFLKSIDVFQLT